MLFVAILFLILSISLDVKKGKEITLEGKWSCKNLYTEISGLKFVNYGWKFIFFEQRLKSFARKLIII